MHGARQPSLPSACVLLPAFCSPVSPVPVCSCLPPAAQSPQCLCAPICLLPDDFFVSFWFGLGHKFLWAEEV